MIALTLCCLFSVQAELPQWSASELKEIEAGNLTVGESLFKSVSSDFKPSDKIQVLQQSLEEILAEQKAALEKKTKKPTIPPISEKKLILPPRPKPLAATPERHSLKTIKDERYTISLGLTSRYFSQPLSTSIHDPQSLLSNEERLDFQHSLEQYSDTSSISIYLYIFDREQQVADGNNIESTFNKFYNSEPVVAVIYYYMGQPERAQIKLGGIDTHNLSSFKIRELSKGVRMSAKRYGSNVDQLEEFLRELSLQLFWIEKAIIEGKDLPPIEQQKLAETIQPKPSKGRFDAIIEVIKPKLKTIFLSVSLILLTSLFLFIFITKKKMYFPRVNIPKRLSLPNGTHCSASMSFEDPESPPSIQLKETERGI